jgi:hypothetical protein
VRPLEEFLNEVAEKIDAKLEAGRIDTPAISLRDYFAGQYLSGIIAKHGDQIGQFVAARDAYLIADEMLKARGGDEND